MDSSTQKAVVRPSLFPLKLISALIKTTSTPMDPGAIKIGSIMNSMAISMIPDLM